MSRNLFYIQASEHKAELHQEIQQTLIRHSHLFQLLFRQNASITAGLESLGLELASLESRSEDLQSIPSKRDLYESLRISGPFQMSLQLRGVFPNPVCKGKYFTFSLRLVSETLQFPPHFHLLLSVQLYSAESPPRPITVNMNGQHIMKGDTKALLKFSPEENTHIATFKVLINEVTSHFRNGWIFLLVLPDHDNEFLNQSGLTVKPLLIEHLVSKAKEITCSRWRAKGKVRDIQPLVDE